jgi:hypothetical protein
MLGALKKAILTKQNDFLSFLPRKRLRWSATAGHRGYIQPVIVKMLVVGMTTFDTGHFIFVQYLRVLR